MVGVRLSSVGVGGDFWYTLLLVAVSRGGGMRPLSSSETRRKITLNSVLIVD